MGYPPLGAPRQHEPRPNAFSRGALPVAWSSRLERLRVEADGQYYHYMVVPPYRTVVLWGVYLERTIKRVEVAVITSSVLPSGRNCARAKIIAFPLRTISPIAS